MTQKRAIQGAAMNLIVGKDLYHKTGCKNCTTWWGTLRDKVAQGKLLHQDEHELHAVVQVTCLCAL